MPIVAADLIARLAANHADNDTATQGGSEATGVDSGRPEFTQFTANAVVAAVSDGADTRTLNVEGRNAAGAIATDALVLTGATEVVGTTTFERLLKWSMSATDATRTVTGRQGAGGATRATITPNEGKRWAFFKRAASEAAIAIRYELEYWKNTHGTLTLNDAKTRLSADPAARIRVGVGAAKGNLGTIANRKTTPGGITFVDDNVDQAVPTDTLAAGEVIGLWVEVNSPANDPAVRNTFTTQLSGTTV